MRVAQGITFLFFLGAVYAGNEINFNFEGMIPGDSCCAGSGYEHPPKGGFEYQPRIREYFIAADEINWDYTPLAYANPAAPINQLTGEPITEDDDMYTFTNKEPTKTIGHVYRKAQYRQYTDGSFTTIVEKPDEFKHTGILGPIIRAVVGDTVVIHFKNHGTNDYSMHPHGLKYDKASEGATYNDGTGGNPGGAVAPGGEVTYTWNVPARAGPGPADGSSIAWLYHSHVDSVSETNAGLFGVIIVTDAEHVDEVLQDRPKDVDREVISLLTVFDENSSILLPINEAANEINTDDFTDEDAELYEESNLMHAINGWLFADGGNNVVLNEDDSVRWYVFGAGTEVDLHTAHWHGVTVRRGGHVLDVQNLLPASHESVTLYADNPGTWVFHCHVNDHLSAGMQSLFTIQPK